jgi:UDPglucose--hexose-1-phosphate uridylyltransferase
MMELELPRRRLHPLTGEWVLVSPQRAGRPWLGQVEKTPPENLPACGPTARRRGLSETHYRR